MVSPAMIRGPSVPNCGRDCIQSAAQAADHWPRVAKTTAAQEFKLFSVLVVLFYCDDMPESRGTPKSDPQWSRTGPALRPFLMVGEKIRMTVMSKN